MGNFCETQERPRECTGFYSVDLATAQPCPGVGRIAIIQAEGDNLRYRMDGVDPDANTGALLLENACIELHTSQLSNIRLITATTGGSANIHTFK